VSSYYHAKKREAEPSPREIRDVVLKEKIMKVREGEKGRKVYGARKVWLELNSGGVPVARCAVERLMRELGIRGASPGRKRPPATLPGDPADRPSDLLGRCFDAEFADIEAFRLAGANHRASRPPAGPAGG
jgi:putative transposase